MQNTLIWLPADCPLITSAAASEVPSPPPPAWLPSPAGAPPRAGPQGGKLWPSEFLGNMDCRSVLGCSQKCSPSGPWSLSQLTSLEHHNTSPYPPYTHTHTHTHTLFPLHFHISLDMPVCFFKSGSSFLILQAPHSSVAPKKPSLTPLITVLISLNPTAYVFLPLALL